MFLDGRLRELGHLAIPIHPTGWLEGCCPQRNFRLNNHKLAMLVFEIVDLTVELTNRKVEEAKKATPGRRRPKTSRRSRPTQPKTRPLPKTTRSRSQRRTKASRRKKSRKGNPAKTTKSKKRKTKNTKTKTTKTKMRRRPPRITWEKWAAPWLLPLPLPPRYFLEARWGQLKTWTQPWPPF